MDKKLYFEILKFKITLFTTIMGAGIYILLNKDKLIFIGEIFFYIIVGVLMIYGFFGFIFNMLKLSDLEKELK